MTDTYNLPRPASLIPGSHYRRLQWDGAGCQAGLVAVEFLAYTACPAFVVVAQAQRRLRCPRDDLFEAADFRRSRRIRPPTLREGIPPPPLDKGGYPDFALINGGS